MPDVDTTVEVEYSPEPGIAVDNEVYLDPQDIPSPVDQEMLLRALRLLIQPGYFADLRSFQGTLFKISSIATDIEHALEYALEMSEDKSSACLTLNPIYADDECIQAIAAKGYLHDLLLRLSEEDFIARRSRLLIHFEAVRPSRIPASEDEHAIALERANQCKALLDEYGWPSPAIFDTGNGVSLIYGIDLPADEESGALIRGVVDAIDFMFSDAAVKVDKRTRSATATCMLPGILNYSCEEREGRVDRLVQIIDAPETLEAVSRESLATVASIPPKPARYAGNPRTRSHYQNIERWIACVKIPVIRQQLWHKYKDAYYWVVTCPCDENCAGHSAYIVRFADGQIAAGCFHRGCLDRDWETFRDTYELKFQEVVSESHDEDPLDDIDPINDCELFHTASGKPYAVIRLNYGNEVTEEVGTHEFYEAIRLRNYQLTGEFLSDARLKPITEKAKALAKFESTEYPIHLRVAGSNDRVYLDLANGHGEVVEVTPDGWQIISNAPVFFFAVLQACYRYLTLNMLGIYMNFGSTLIFLLGVLVGFSLLDGY